MTRQRYLFHRVDPRLVHSTLIEAWVPHLRASRLVVVDELLLESERQRNIIELSTRDLLSCEFVRPTELAEHLREELKTPTIILYSSLRGVVGALEAGLQLSTLYIGHLPAAGGRFRVHPAVYVGEEELACIQTIIERGTRVVVWPLPSDEKRGLRRGNDDRPVLTDALEETGDLEPAVSTRSAPAVLSATESEHRESRVVVTNERGLHLRAAHVLAQQAGLFRSSVQLGIQGRLVNAKSLLGITTLGAGLGTELTLVVEGPDAEQASEAIVTLFKEGFHE